MVVRLLLLSLWLHTLLTSAQWLGKALGSIDFWSEGWDWFQCCDLSLGVEGNHLCWDHRFNFQLCCALKEAPRSPAGTDCFHRENFWQCLERLRHLEPELAQALSANHELIHKVNTNPLYSTVFLAPAELSETSPLKRLLVDCPVQLVSPNTLERKHACESMSADQVYFRQMATDLSVVYVTLTELGLYSNAFALQFTLDCRTIGCISQQEVSSSLIQTIESCFDALQGLTSSLEHDGWSDALDTVINGYAIFDADERVEAMGLRQTVEDIKATIALSTVSVDDVARCLQHLAVRAGAAAQKIQHQLFASLTLQAVRSEADLDSVNFQFRGGYCCRRYHILAALLAALPTQNGSSLRVLEIGVHVAMNAVMLLREPLDVEYVGVDPYLVGNEAMFEEAAARLQPFGSRARLLRMSSSEAIQQFATGTFDLVFIDGSHDFASVRQDILMWRDRVKSPGILSGHDLFNPEGCEGVLDAIVSLKQSHSTDRFMGGKTVNFATDYMWWWEV